MRVMAYKSSASANIRYGTYLLQKFITEIQIKQNVGTVTRTFRGLFFLFTLCIELRLTRALPAVDIYIFSVRILFPPLQYYFRLC
jgi:hypothetical protein